MNIFFFKAVLIFYFAGTLIFLLFLFKQKSFISKVATTVLFSGFIFHTISLTLRYFEAGYLPITNLHEAPSFLAWTIVFLYLIVQFKYKIDVLGSFISPLAFILITLSAAFSKEIGPLPSILKSTWLPIHVLVAFLGNAIFALAFCAGVMYLIQEYQIKSKRIGSLYYRLPSLKLLDDINHSCLSIGFPLLTIAMVSGSIWARFAWGSFWNWDAKEIWTLLTWIFYAALLHGRINMGWRGKRAAVFAIVGFFAVMFSFLGINTMCSVLHSYER
ncbi:MAG: c-type cytochrome biogenesis protein CcsB [Thermodesulfobacteriota bacterium]|nr:c-type cytochrome biogenesis protein CcsB [Thermodesulfobacteriota bacterium]